MNATPNAIRAIILAAGLGSRLRPLTSEIPKPLVEVHGTPILHNALRSLAAVGVRETTIVVGYRREMIERSCGREFAGMRITYIRSSLFDRTGSAYSLWLAREALLQDEALILEGDVFFEPSLLTRVLVSALRDVGAVAPFTAALSGTAAILDERGLVRRILMKQTIADQYETPLYKTINVYRFSADTLRQHLVPALDETIQSGATTTYVEQVLGRLVARRVLELGVVKCGDLNWFEIDDHNDLRVAEQIFAPEIAYAPAAT